MATDPLQLPDDIRKRLEYVGFTDADAERIRAIAPLIRDRADELADAFFATLEPFPEAAGLLGDPRLRAEARALKVAHLRAMVNGRYDRAYVDERLRLAQLYSRARLDQRLFLAAFHHVISEIGARIVEADPDHALDAFERYRSIRKIAIFDVSLITDSIVAERERVIVEQQRAIRELSTPVLRVRDGMLVVPLIGALDSARARQLTESLLHAVRTSRAVMVILDVTGVPIVDGEVANHLVQTIISARLMGARTIVTGVSAEVATALIELGIDTALIDSVGDLQEGIAIGEDALRAKGTDGVRTPPATASTIP